ncbi:unnamed protein product [Hyaloperonospora brassicae]|uniref:Uncharacterized protein n=1 Tax=Hyaloperonospora brassicae TaxID=162125 RepID=A0AAV0UU60_HYABA|nr:unnamed protein product [Hyaloperonospora brassicae]
MAAVSLHGVETAFGNRRDGMTRSLSPTCGHAPASPLRQRRFNLKKLRELARSDEFSDSESDGVDSEEKENVDGVADAVAGTEFVPYRFPLSPCPIVVARRRKQQKKSDYETGSSAKGDEWEVIDKSPTFESIAEGTMDLGGESWFVQEREQ